MSSWASPPSSVAPNQDPVTGRSDAPREPHAPPVAPAPPRRWRAARQLVAACVAAAAVAVVVGLASRAGGLPGSPDPGRPAAHELVPRVVLGTLLATGAAFGLAFALHLRFAPRLRSGRRRRFGHTVAVGAPLLALAAAFGALAGASTTPLRQHGALTRDAGFTLTARPVDADGDGRPDADAQGRAVLGLDLDGDGRVDRQLAPCPGAQSLSAAQVAAAAQPGAARIQVVVDTNCDGVAERIVYLDPRPAPLAPDAIRPDRPDAAAAPLEVINRSTDRIRGLLAALAVAAVAALAGMVVLGLVLALRGAKPRTPSEAHPTRTLVAGDFAVDRARAAEAFGESIDALLTDPDPRTGIIGAYAKLLDGLSAAGLPRRPEEAPLEHLARCLEALAVPPDPLERLTELFVLARFSTHPLHEGHRLDALDALRAALGHLAEQPEPFANARRA